MKPMRGATLGFFGLLGLCTAAAAGTTSESIPFAGKQRSFLLTAPATGDAALPLVIALHFYPGSGRGMADLTGFSELAEREGFLVAYPDGINGGFNAMYCCGNEDDVGFIQAVIDEIAATHKVDPTRIYATGISNGADLTYRLAAKLPGVFAAIAPVSGGMSGDWMQMKTGNLPTTPVSLIYFYGKKDRYQVVFGLGAKFWLEKQRCSSEVSTLAGTDIELTKGGCADGSSAAIYALPEMGHAWPGSKGNDDGMLGYEAAPFKATDLIWRFFRDNPKE